MILGGLLYDSLTRMGAYARLIGFVIALVYFGTLNRRIVIASWWAKHGYSLKPAELQTRFMK
jgi:hypothetical protein